MNDMTKQCPFFCNEEWFMMGGGDPTKKFSVGNIHLEEIPHATDAYATLILQLSNN